MRITAGLLGAALVVVLVTGCRAGNTLYSFVKVGTTRGADGSVVVVTYSCPESPVVALRVSDGDGHQVWAASTDAPTEGLTSVSTDPTVVTPGWSTTGKVDPTSTSSLAVFASPRGEGVQTTSMVPANLRVDLISVDVNSFDGKSEVTVDEFTARNKHYCKSG